MVHGRLRRGGGAPAGLRRPGPAGRCRPLHLARRARRAARRRPGRRVEAVDRAARWSRARTGSRSRLAPAGQWWLRRAPPRGGRPRAAPGRGPLVRGPLRRRAAARATRVEVIAWAGDLADQPPRRRRRSWRRPGRATGPWSRRRSRPTTWTPPSRWRPTRSSCAPATGAGRGGRLPVVRCLVPGHDDLVRGVVPRHRPGRRGARAAAAYAATLSEGMLANTADTGRRGVQHRRRDAVVPARGEPARRVTGDVDLGRRAAARAARRRSTRTRRAPVRHPRRPGRRAAHPGRRRARR